MLAPPKKENSWYTYIRRQKQNVLGANIFDEYFWVYEDSFSWSTPKNQRRWPFYLSHLHCVDVITCVINVLDNASITKSYPFVKIIVKSSNYSFD